MECYCVSLRDSLLNVLELCYKDNIAIIIIFDQIVCNEIVFVLADSCDRFLTALESCCSMVAFLHKVMQIL